MSIHFLVACVLSFKLYIKKYFFGIHFLTHRNQNCIHFNKPCMTLFTNKFHTTKNYHELKTTLSSKPVEVNDALSRHEARMEILFVSCDHHFWT